MTITYKTKPARLADNGYGDLVSTTNPYGETTTVYSRAAGKLCKFIADTGDHQEAISLVRDHLGLRNKTPVFALIQGGLA